MLLADLAHTSDVIGATRSRTAKTTELAAALAHLRPDEIEAGVAFLSGELRQRQIGVGWAALGDVPAPSSTGPPTLAVHDVDAAFDAIGRTSGPGSQAARKQALHALFAQATPAEQTYLRRLLGGDLRQGALEGLMVQALAKATATTPARVQRAFMLRGDLAPVAHAALTEGPNALDRFTLEVGRPVRPMLARPAKDVDDAFGKLKDAPAAAEAKLDGARIQVHRSGSDVAVFTRSLDDVTARVPEIVVAARALPVADVVLDGEAIALKPGGRPQPFQVTASRFATSSKTPAIALTPFLFDVLRLDGNDTIDLPGRERAALLAELVPHNQRTPREPVTTTRQARDFLARTLDAGHEGIMLKALDAPYAAGSRGAGWLKVKPVHTLDLVVLAAEWGHGRRRGWLSNLHLGARDPGDSTATSFVMLGKTFKGLTDEMLAWQTRRLLELETARTRYAVQVRPELVVEIAFDGIQTSPRYPGGVALRFARVIRHRPDKPAAEADTLDAVLSVAG
ncbi:ATP-dependent DNA ligase [Capillimicrobium parvum]|uniref:ATP-dependent DNA ligase n=1 Tax=Capillimicrobium parvum TaxID=2884022 RepID=UPI0038996CF2